MKMHLVPVILLVALSACGTDPKATSSVTAWADPTPTLAASSTTSSPSPTPTSTETHPSASPSSAGTSSSTGPAGGAVVTLPGTGTTFGSVGQVNAATWLSPEAKVFVSSELKRVQVDGTCAHITITGYRVPDLLNGGVGGCGGGYAVLWGKTSSGWKVVIAGQDVPGCQAIRTAGWKTTIPKNFYGGQCYQGSSVVTYTP